MIKRERKQFEEDYNIDYWNLTPEYLRKIADDLEKRNILKMAIELEYDYDDSYITTKVYRLETDEEFQERLNTLEENARKRAIKKAKKK